MSELIWFVKNHKNETYGWLWHGVLSFGSTGFISWLHLSVPNSESAHRKNSLPIFFWQTSQWSQSRNTRTIPSRVNFDFLIANFTKTCFGTFDEYFLSLSLEGAPGIKTSHPLREKNLDVGTSLLRKERSI